jgi:adenosylhomocysteine nucleosidase
MDDCIDYIVLISANAEWRVTRSYFPQHELLSSPYGEWFIKSNIEESDINKSVIFFHGGWGKVASAGATQYVISKWQPRIIINLGTCGGFKGSIKRGEVILVEKTVIYDIYEQMGDPDEHIQHYMTAIDNSWLIEPYPIPVRRTVLISGDRDLFWKDLSDLKTKYGAIAGDWESGSIAWIAAKNHTPCLILRGVTDLVDEEGGEAYNGKITTYHENTISVMKTLLVSLPGWLVQFKQNYTSETLE